MRTGFASLLVLALVFPAARPPLRAQTSTGEIDVTVADVSGAVVAGVRVTVTGSDTGNVARTSSTNALGLAAIPLLNPSTYDVKVEKEGFRATLRKSIILQVTEIVAVRVTLELGATTQSVTVAGETPLVDTVTNTQGQVVNCGSRKIRFG